ncbi:MAG: hypothetical protein PF488_00045 [Patescibacteria group bacterium]|nr:hypothetical protein [Patescibacteria group bacterium]
MYSFLKNPTYFVPIGMIANLFGNRKNIIVSKFLILLSFIFFGFAGSFITLLLANLLYELGKSFKSGTETTYVFNYLDDIKDSEDNPKYTKIKIKNKDVINSSQLG